MADYRQGFGEEDDDEYDVQGESEVDNSDLIYDDANLYIQLNEVEEFRNRLKISYKILKDTYPKLFGQQVDMKQGLEEIMRHTFMEGMAIRCYISNLTFTNNKGNDVKILEIRLPKEGVYLNEVLPEGITLRFKGHVSRGNFIVDEISTTAAGEKREFEVEVEKVRPFRGNNNESWSSNFLNRILEEAKSITKHTQDKLEEWEAYLKWRKEVAKRQIAGCKYYDIKSDCAEQHLIFSVVCEGKEEFDAFRRYLRRDNLQAFNNAYSENRWHFSLKDSKKDKNNKQKGTELGKFKKIKAEYYLSERFNLQNTKVEEDEELENSIYDFEDIDNSYNIEDEEEAEDKNKVEIVDEKEISKNYQNPYIAELVFELSKEYSDEILEKGYNDEEINELIQNEVIGEYEKDGFIALSAIGDFALISRFERAIEQLKRDDNFSPNLALWLFDISKARLPREFVSITKWLNKGIESNNDQRKAVIKMLSAPDLCLIQGPPGTGKTTVIAEAIYQFVIKGKRVLLASQSNDAVDNALERLANTPAIRAIRLGKKRRRKGNNQDEVARKFDESNALDYFYQSLEDEISREWLGRWKNLDDLQHQYRIDKRDIILQYEAIEESQQLIQPHNETIKNLQTGRKQLETLYAQRIIQQEQINHDKVQLEALKEFIQSGEDMELVLSKEILNQIIEQLKPILAVLSNAGINLNTISFDNIEEISQRQVSMGLKQTIQAFRQLNQLKEKVLKGDASQQGKNNELALLERQKIELTEAMDKADLEGDDDTYDKINTKRRKINQKIKDLKEANNLIILSEVDKTLFTKSVQLQLEQQSQIKDVLLRNIFEIIQDYMMQFEGVLERISNITLTDEAAQIQEDCSSLQERLEINQAQINNEKGEIKNLRTRITGCYQFLQEQYRKYEVEDHSVDTLLNKVNELIESNQKLIESQKLLREEWEGIFKEFTKRLGDEQSRKYDKSYYQDIYIRACNVVGVSCTDSMRTLADSGYNDFDVVIIDEVSKATPPELLIPLMKGRQTVLVGDHRQLPPLFNEHEKSYKELIATVAEENEELVDIMTEENFERFKNMVTASLFKEYFERADESIKHSLFTQYRMHSDIMHVINRFYSGKLQTGLDSKEETEKKAHNLTIKGVDGSRFIEPTKHAYWLDSSKLPNGKPFYESRPQGSTSTENILECHMIMQLVNKIAIECAKKGYSKEKPKTVGIISFYQLQVNRLRSMLRLARKKQAEMFSCLQIDINTVDRFQGKEKAIVITSLVRNVERKRLNVDSHIAAFERINVAFSRAQEMLVIVGAKDMYMKQPVKLPNMDTPGERTEYVYGNIIEDLNRHAEFFDSSKIIDEEVMNKVIEERKKTGGNKL